MMRYVCTDCDWHVDSDGSIADDLGALAVEHHVRFGHPVELRNGDRPRDERTADNPVET